MASISSHRADAGDFVVVIVETWRLGPLEKGFPGKRQHADRVGGKNQERWGWFADAASVLQRLDTAAVNVLLFAAPLHNKGT